MSLSKDIQRPEPGQSSLTIPLKASRSIGVEAFIEDMQSMCLLIEEAANYGTTATMEANYSVLKQRAAAGFRSASETIGEAVLPLAGFHGCGFEMILGPYSLDALIQGSPRKIVSRLREIRKAVECAHLQATAL